jgi:hypothetical protein
MYAYIRKIVMKKVGFVGWRGMVGSVLLARMHAENDFAHIDAEFFTTSNIGGKGPGESKQPLKDAKSIADLKRMDAIITCQGGDYTNEIQPQLRAAGWDGFWIDAASALRMKNDAVIILDPVNMRVIRMRCARREELYRRQLHRQPDADGAARLVQGRADRMDDCDDLSGGLGRRRAEHARADRPDGRSARLGR